MANTITWSNLEHIFVATGPVYLRGIVQSYFRESPFLALIQQKGNVEKVSVSGPTVVERIRAGKNTTVGWRSTRSDVPIAEQSSLHTAAWEWGTLTGSVTFYDEDLHDNMGEAQLVNLVQVTMDQLADTIKYKLAKAILDETSGTAGEAGEVASARILGLKDGTAPGYASASGATVPPQPVTYGGIKDTDIDPDGYIPQSWTGNAAPSSYSGHQGLWSPVVIQGGAVGLVDDKLRTLVNRCTYGPIKPDFILTDLALYEAYEATMTANIRYTNLNVGDQVFEGLAVRGVPLIADPLCTPILSNPSGWLQNTTVDGSGTSRAYAIRAADWKWFFDPQWDLTGAVEDTWRIPEDGFRRTKLVCIRSQLVCVNRTTQGLLWNQATS